MSRRREVGRFKAYDDAENAVDIIEYVEMIPDPSFENPDAEIDGLRVFQTKSGKHVNPIGRDYPPREFDILRPGQEPRRVRRAKG